MEEIILVDGFNAKKINEDFWGLSFNVEKFKDFLDTYKNENGYVSINICKSKKQEGKFYGKLNLWKPSKEPKF